MDFELGEEFAPDALGAAGVLETGTDPGYVYPEDPASRAALERWQDHKVGVIIHWGIYSSIGQDGSWSLHRERLGGFTDPPDDWEGGDAEYHSWYRDQARRFTGEAFDAEAWARACADAGMRYLVFTTKHHDGFAMYDTDYSNFKATAEDSGLGRDVVREVFDAFRARGLDTGVYFSKADWNHPGYWDRAKPLKDRFHNYDIDARPAKWRSFVDYTKNQIEELLMRYGTINVLWLDAGWVRAPYEPIDMDRIADRARELQPGILVVDREVHGRNEDYRTPEQEVPGEVLDYPWESCITMGRGWCAMRHDDPIKPMRHLIDNLLAIVSRGGNYLIGIGPDADGRMPDEVKRGLSELGAWMRINGEGIYASRPWEGASGLRGSQGWNWYATRSRDDGALVHLFGIPPRDPADAGMETFEAPGIPSTSITVPGRFSSVRILGDEGVHAELITDGGDPDEASTRIVLPATRCSYAIGLALEFA